MLINPTDSEKQILNAMTQDFNSNLDAIRNEIAQYEAGKPDIKPFYLKSPSPSADEQNRLDDVKKQLAEWYDNAPAEWVELDNKRNSLVETFFLEREAFIKMCEQRQFSELNEDPQEVERDFYTEVDEYIKTYFRIERENIQAAERYESDMVIKLDNENRWKLNPDALKAAIKRELRLHYGFFADNPEMIRRLNDYLEREIEKSDLVARQNEIAAELTTPWIENKNAVRTPSLTSHKARTYMFPNDKISNTVFDKSEYFFNCRTPIGMEKRGSGNQIDTFVTLKCMDNGKEIKEMQLEYFDYCVLSAVYSLIRAGNAAITPLMIARCSNGNGYEGSGGSDFIREINKSIERLFYINIEIDATNEVNAQKSRYKGPQKIVRRLLPGGLDEQVVRGKKVWAYIPSSEPLPLIEYAEGKGQVISFETRLLNLPLDNSKENTVIKNYLIKRIELMQGTSALSKNRKILYDTLFKECRITSQTAAGLRKKKTGVRKKIRTMLDEWVKMGYISGYEEIKKGNSYEGVKIRLKPQNGR